MTKQKILLCGKIHHAHKELEQLKQEYEVIVPTSKDRKEFIHDLDTKYTDFEVIYRTFSSYEYTGQFDEELMSHMPKTLKAIANFGAGYDQLDVPALTKRHVQLANTPSAVDRGTADTAIYLLLGALRNFAFGSHQLRQGKWLQDVSLGHDPVGKVLGIVGMGGIGRTFRDRVLPFEFKKIIYYNRSRLSPELEKGAEYVSLDQLYAESDVISLNLPLSPETRYLINKDTIAKMKDGVVIINTARGPVINEEDLVEGLKSGKIGSVGLDVFENEPEIHPYLLKDPKALLLPHMGTHSYESRYDMEALGLKNVKSVLETGKVITLVNDQKDVFK